MDIESWYQISKNKKRNIELRNSHDTFFNHV